MNFGLIREYIDGIPSLLFSRGRGNTFLETIYSFVKFFIRGSLYYLIIFIFSIFFSSFIITSTGFFFSDFFFSGKYPFWVFFSIYFFCYLLSSQILNFFRITVQFNFIFHFFFVFVVLNLVNTYLYYKFFYVNAGVYFFVVFFYLFLVVLSYLFNLFHFFIVCIVTFGIYLFACLNGIPSLLFLTNVIVYEATSLELWPKKFFYRALKTGPINHDMADVNVYYKHFGDSFLTWDHSIFSYICLYLFLALVAFFFFNFFYFWIFIKFRALNSYRALNFLVLSTSGFLIYYFIGVYINFYTKNFLWEVWDTYLVISTYSSKTDYRTYLMLGTYFGLLIFLYMASYPVMRIILQGLSEVPYVSDHDYDIKKRLLFGPKFSHMLWYFPSPWIKRIVALTSEKEEEEIPEDALYYYGGPNPHRVLFDRVTGEVTPIMDADLVLDAYRKYYKFHKFASYRPALWYFSLYEKRWTNYMVFDRRRYLKILRNPGVFYFYPFKEIFTDYRLGRIISYDDAPADEYGNPVHSFFDSKMWEHVWYKSFGRHLPRGIRVLKSGRSFFNPLLSSDPSANSVRPRLEGREPFLNAYVFRMNYMGKRSNLVEFNFNSPQLSKLGFVRAPSIYLNRLNGLKAYVNQEFKMFESLDGNPDFELFFLRILDLLSNSRDWFFKNSGKVSKMTFEYNFDWFSGKLESRPKTAWFRYGFPARYVLLRRFAFLIFKTFKVLILKDSDYISKFGYNKDFNSSQVGLNRIVSHTRRNIEFGFLEQFGEFGFSVNDPFPGSDEFIESKFILGNFSKFTSYGVLVNQFINFPMFNYLSKWELQFSGFFEKDSDLSGSNPIRGRFGRFRYVNSKILLENETSPKINDYFVNIFDWLKSTGSAKFSEFEVFPILSRFYKFRFFFGGSSAYSKFNANKHLFTEPVTSTGSSYAYYDSSNSEFYKADLLNSMDPMNEPAFGRTNISKSELEVAYESFPLTDYGFKTSINPNKVSFSRRGLYYGLSRYGYDDPIRSVYSSTGIFYMNTYIRNFFFSEFTKGLSSSGYFISKFYDFYNEKFSTPFFYPFFDQKFSNTVLKFNSLSQTVFLNLGANYVSMCNEKIFKIFNSNNVYWKNFYIFKSVLGPKNSFFRYISDIFSKYYYNSIIRNAKLYIPPVESANYFSKKKITGSRILYNNSYSWGLRFIWYPENISKNEFYASRSQIRSNISFLDRFNVDLEVNNNSLVFSEFENFEFFFGNKKVFQNFFK